jgi:4'-phosphopantetheinyl transferase
MILFPLRWVPGQSIHTVWAEYSNLNYQPLIVMIDCRDNEVTEVRSELLQILADDEHVRLHQYRRAEDRDRFLLARGCLRLLLGQFLLQPPAKLVIQCDVYGKPFLGPIESSTMNRTLHFNVSHSGELILLGFHGFRCVGVDVELHSVDLDWHSIAKRCFPHSIISALRKVPSQDQLHAFYQEWCRLEAKLKASGLGLSSLDLPDYTPDASADDDTHCWDIRLPNGYSGAAALHG